MFAKTVALCIAGAIYIINYILKIILRWCSEFSKYSTRTDFNISLSVKLSLAMFFNTALMPFIVECFVPFILGDIKTA